MLLLFFYSRGCGARIHILHIRKSEDSDTADTAAGRYTDTPDTDTPDTITDIGKYDEDRDG